MNNETEVKLSTGARIAIILCITMLSGLISVPAFESGAQGLYYVSEERQTGPGASADGSLLPSGTVRTAYGVTEEMCKASYWYDKTADSFIGPDQVLISREEIQRLNEETLKEPGSNMNDLEKFGETYDADSLRKSLAKGTVSPNKPIYVNQAPVKDVAGWYKYHADAIEATGYTDTKAQTRYAVAVHRTEIRAVPSSAYVGYSKGDSDNEIVSSALNVNEPFVVRQRALVDGEEFLWGYSDLGTGWVAAEDIAICKDRDEWLDAWKIDPYSKDFIVVAQNQIRLEPSLADRAEPDINISLSASVLSELKLTFATILKEVPENEIPGTITKRGVWNNHVVYVPVRNSDGSYKKVCALISQHYDVFTGFPEMTQAGILRVSFNNLGDRYGWGGMMDSMDCSLFTRNVYRCFGLNLPRNTNWQQALPGRRIDLAGMSDEEKMNAICRMPAGTLLYFPGHAMIYTGTADYAFADMTGDTGIPEASGYAAYMTGDTGIPEASGYAAYMTGDTGIPEATGYAAYTTGDTGIPEASDFPADTAGDPAAPGTAAGSDLPSASGSTMAYVISDTGSLSDSPGEPLVRTMYSILLNPLTVRRGLKYNYTTWLANLTAAVLPISSELVEFVNKNITDLPEPEPGPGKKVPASEGQTFAASTDTLPLETFLKTTKTEYISFANVDKSEIETLSASVLKGSSVTTRSKVNEVNCDRSIASVKINKNNSLATLKFKKSGTVSFLMADGVTYSVYFSVETPKAQSRALKQMIAEAKAAGEDTLTFDIRDLFATGIDLGDLEIVSDKAGNAKLAGNTVTVSLKAKNTVKVRYTYLDKKYSATLNVP